MKGGLLRTKRSPYEGNTFQNQQARKKFKQLLNPEYRNGLSFQILSISYSIQSPFALYSYQTISESSDHIEGFRPYRR